MRKRRFTGQFAFAGAAMFAAALAVPALGVVIVDDSFTDGNLAKTGALDTNWWTSSSSSALEIAVGSMGLVTGTSGRGIHTVFASQTLSNVGDKIIATYTFTTPATIGGTSSSSTSFKLGLFDTLGRALNQDHTYSSGSPNSIYGWNTVGGTGDAGIPGYMLDMDVNAPLTNDLTIREHVVGATNGQFLGTSGNFATIGSTGPDGVYAWAANTSYTGSITIERTSATEVTITGTLGAESHSVVDNVDPSFVFDMLAFHVNSNRFGSTSAQNTPDNGIDFTNVKIEFIPEPASIALLGLGGLAMLRRRA